jgi:hypothetical protein
MALPPTTDQTRADGFRRRAIELAEEARNEARPGGGSLIDKARSSIAPADMLAPELPPEPQIFRKLRSMGV